MCFLLVMGDFLIDLSGFMWKFRLANNLPQFDTPWKFNIGPENIPSQKESRAMLNFGRVGFHQTVSDWWTFGGLDGCYFCSHDAELLTGYFGQTSLGGGFKYFLFSTLLGEMIQVD